MKVGVALGVVGVVFGVVLGNIGFGSWEQVHRMFTLRDPRLILTFAGAVALLIPVYWLLRRRLSKARPRTTWRTVIGAVLFGVGWALTGACPSIVLVTLGGGSVPAIAVLLGVVAGVLAYQRVQKRWLPDDSAACDS